LPEISELKPLETYDELARMADYAAMAPNASEEQIAAACEVARSWRVGRFTVRPADLDLVTKWMEGSGVRIGVAIDYPHGASTTSAKLYAVRDALGRGAKAIETVLNPGKTVSRQFRYVESELQQMAQECHRAGAELIVDLELGWLAEDLRVIACRIAKRAEVDWVRGGSLYGPGQYGRVDLEFLVGKLGDLVKVDAGSTVATFQDALDLHQAGVQGFQTTDPRPMLDAWSAELKRREETKAAQTAPPATPA
jgi:deoxyribose-phosphate aldolase